MNIKEATIWNKKTGKPISIVGDESNQQYGIWMGKMSKFNPGESCTHETSGLDLGEIIAEWQEWREPREYVSFDKAQEMISIACGLQHSNFPDKERIWSGSSDGTIWDMPVHQAAGEVSKVKAVPVEYLSPEWYVVFGVPTSATSRPRKRSTGESHEPQPSICQECGRLTGYDGEKFRCGACDASWPVEDNEPVFDLTYDEVRETSDNDGVYVQAKGMPTNEFWVLEPDGWHDNKGNRVEAVRQADDIIYFSQQKWRIVE